MDDAVFFQTIQQGALVLTANRRLSRACLRHYQSYQRQQAKQCWPTASIYPLTTYLIELWQQTASAKRIQLLNEQQSLAIWQHIIENSEHGEQLSNSAISAKLAQQAWQQCCLWNVDASHFNQMLNEDQLAFQAWAKTFVNYCEQHHYIDLARIHHHVLTAINEQSLTIPKQIMLHGFDQLNPRDQLLLDSLQAQGSQIDRFEFETQSQTQQTIIFSDCEAQIKTMAKWAEQSAKQGETVACVFPQLSSQRLTIERLFKQQLNKDTIYNISAGSPLKESPIIYAALQVIELANHTIELETVSALLRSPYIGLAETERNQRATFDNALRERGEASLSLKDIVDSLQATQLCPDLCARLTTLRNIALNGKRSLSEWLAVFDQQLQAVAWPGERSLNSEEYQTTQRFLAAFNEFTGLEHVIGSCSYTIAAKHFKQLIGQCALQIQTQQSPIQILGLLEAAGLTFDRIWLADLDDQQWPATASPHPFIPLALQKNLDMPHASAQRELHFSEQVMQRFSQSCQHLYFSYAKALKAQTVQASPLIQAFPTVAADELLSEPLQAPAQQLFATADLIRQQDHHAPALAADENIRGGTFILKEQAACPFRAFAKFRLDAHTVEQTDVGLSGLERGLLLHNALEIIWQTLGDQDTLISYSEQQLQTLIVNSVNKVLKTLARQRKNTLTQQFISIELQRLSTLLQRWLALEKSRPSFTVQAQEFKQDIQLAGLHLSMRVDRIDKTATGETFIIDYKTGKTNLYDWFDERPNEPQLPLYSLASDNIDGLLFAQVRIEDTCFKGLSKQASDINGVKTIEEIKREDITDWQQLQSYWQQNLQQLAEDFCRGDATIDPKNGGLSCQFCDLHALCRINEAAPA